MARVDDAQVGVREDAAYCVAPVRERVGGGGHAGRGGGFRHAVLLCVGGWWEKGEGGRVSERRARGGSGREGKKAAQ